MDLTRTQALDLLKQYNKDPFHIRHALTVEAVMGWFARELGYGDEADFWSAAGLLHDLDFERFPEEHCKKSQEIMAQRPAEGSARQNTTGCCRSKTSWEASPSIWGARL